MSKEISLLWSISWQNSPTTRKYTTPVISYANQYFIFNSEWDRFAKQEYERLAMEEGEGDDSEMIDAMDGWDSEDDGQGQNNN